MCVFQVITFFVFAEYRSHQVVLILFFVSAAHFCNDLDGACRKVSQHINIFGSFAILVQYSCLNTILNPRLLLESGYSPDVIYTSRLKRAIKSAWAIVQEINSPFLPMYKSWRLNERHYGALQGLNKKETAQTFGIDVVQAWRRSLTARPPSVKESDYQYSGNDRKVSGLLPEQIPRSESLLDCMRRVQPMWVFIKRDLLRGENVMVVAHANTLRGLAKIIDGE